MPTNKKAIRVGERWLEPTHEDRFSGVVHYAIAQVWEDKVYIGWIPEWLVDEATLKDEETELVEVSSV